MFDFKTEQGKVELLWFMNNIARVMQSFREKISVGKDLNYTHEFERHSKDLLTNGGLWAYCNDVEETINRMLKTYAVDFSSRGGGRTQDHWIDQVRSLNYSFVI